METTSMLNYSKWRSLNICRADVLSATGTKVYIHLYVSYSTVKDRTSFTFVFLFIFALRDVERTRALHNYL